MIRFEYTYLIGYLFKDENGNSGTGSMSLICNNRINSVAVIDSIQKFIHEQKGFKEVGILTYKLISFRVRFGG